MGITKWEVKTKGGICMTPIEEIEQRILNFIMFEEVIEIEMQDGSVIEVRVSELKDVDVTKGKLAELLYATNRA